MKLIPLASILGVIISTSTIASTAFGTTHSASKMTCEDFVSLDVVSRPKVVYWMECFNLNGKPDDAVIDFDQDERLVPLVYEECVRNPKHLLISKVKAACKKNKG